MEQGTIILKYNFQEIIIQRLTDGNFNVDETYRFLMIERNVFV